MKKINLLSVIIPCYNEEKSIGSIVDEILAVDINPTLKEIIIIDDFSSDKSREILKEVAKKHHEVKVLLQNKNRGKGAALKRGFAESNGDVVIVQDADREYDPKDYVKLLQIFREDRGDIVFGSRFSGGEPKRVVYLINKVGNRVMTRFSAILSGLYVSDIHTCYILFNGDWIRNITPRLQSDRFGFNPEIVARIAKDKDNLRICEVGISYYGRTKAEGKKIGARDGLKAMWEIFYYNVIARG